MTGSHTHKVLGWHNHPSTAESSEHLIRGSPETRSHRSRSLLRNDSGYLHNGLPGVTFKYCDPVMLPHAIMPHCIPYPSMRESSTRIYMYVAWESVRSDSPVRALS